MLTAFLKDKHDEHSLLIKGLQANKYGSSSSMKTHSDFMFKPCLYNLQSTAQILELSWFALCFVCPLPSSFACEVTQIGGYTLESYIRCTCCLATICLHMAETDTFSGNKWNLLVADLITNPVFRTSDWSKKITDDSLYLCLPQQANGEGQPVGTAGLHLQGDEGQGQHGSFELHKH